MIGTLVGTLVRQRLRSPIRMILAFTFLAFGVVPALFANSLDALSRGAMGLFGLLTAAGAIGQELSSGVLMLTFARPLTRQDYVLGRWLGAWGMAAAMVVVQVAAAAAVVASRHGQVDASLIAIKLLEGVCAVAGSAAILVMFSALANGLGDLALLLLSLLAADSMTRAGGHWQIGWLTRAGEEAQRFLAASIDVAPLFGHGTVSWFGVVSYVSTLAICLVVAIWAVNRKELSYASG